MTLCNSENIRFCNSGETDVALPESLELKLMKLDIDSPMENYIAPSMTEEENWGMKTHKDACKADWLSKYKMYLWHLCVAFFLFINNEEILIVPMAM